MALSLAERKRAYRVRHPERVRAANLLWRERHREEWAARRRQKALRGMAYIDSLKTGGCVDCGNKNLTVLDFDHVRGEKQRNLCSMYATTFAEIDAEAAKCEVRCANCHRIVTARRRKAA